jgi:hypothetical protein
MALLLLALRIIARQPELMWSLCPCPVRRVLVG